MSMISKKILDGFKLLTAAATVISIVENAVMEEQVLQEAVTEEE